MQRVILIGDSIRIGYQAGVVRLLEDECRIWAPNQNGQTSANVLAHLDEWVLSRTPDLVHLNCGLHDLKRERPGGALNVPLEAYRNNLETIFRRILDLPATRLVWAATTPVNDQWHRHNTRKPFDRRNQDVVEYNQAATDIAARFNVPINDLYAVVCQAGRDRLLKSDGVHFVQEGAQVLARAVAEAIRKALTLPERPDEADAPTAPKGQT